MRKEMNWPFNIVIARGKYDGAVAVKIPYGQTGREWKEWRKKCTRKDQTQLQSLVKWQVKAECAEFGRASISPGATNNYLYVVRAVFCALLSALVLSVSCHTSNSALWGGVKALLKCFIDQQHITCRRSAAIAYIYIDSCLCHRLV